MVISNIVLNALYSLALIDFSDGPCSNIECDRTTSAFRFSYRLPAPVLSPERPPVSDFLLSTKAASFSATGPTFVLQRQMIVIRQTFPSYIVQYTDSDCTRSTLHQYEACGPVLLIWDGVASSLTGVVTGLSFTSNLKVLLKITHDSKQHCKMITLDISNLETLKSIDFTV